LTVKAFLPHRYIIDFGDVRILKILKLAVSLRVSGGAFGGAHHIFSPNLARSGYFLSQL